MHSIYVVFILLIANAHVLGLDLTIAYMLSFAYAKADRNPTVLCMQIPCYTAEFPTLRLICCSGNK